MSLVYHANGEITDVARASIRQYVYFTAGYAWLARTFDRVMTYMLGWHRLLIGYGLICSVGPDF